MVPLPDRTLTALRLYWCEHRHPAMIFPNRVGSLETMRGATTHMDKGGAQSAMKRVVDACNIKKKFQSIPFATHLQLTSLNAA
jgi:integrase